MTHWQKHYTGIDFQVQLRMSGTDYHNQVGQYCIVLCTTPDQQSAESIAKQLVTERLAACVNIVPSITSIYQWNGNLEKSQEILLIAKSRTEMFDSVKNAILALHPYELPEIIGIPLQNGHANYLAWIDANIDIEDIPAS